MLSLPLGPCRNTVRRRRCQRVDHQRVGRGAASEAQRATRPPAGRSPRQRQPPHRRRSVFLLPLARDGLHSGALQARKKKEAGLDKPALKPSLPRRTRSSPPGRRGLPSRALPSASVPEHRFGARFRPGSRRPGRCGNSGRRVQPPRRGRGLLAIGARRMLETSGLSSGSASSSVTRAASTAVELRHAMFVRPRHGGRGGGGDKARQGEGASWSGSGCRPDSATPRTRAHAHRRYDHRPMPHLLDGRLVVAISSRAVRLRGEPRLRGPPTTAPVTAATGAAGRAQRAPASYLLAGRKLLAFNAAAPGGGGDPLAQRPVSGMRVFRSAALGCRRARRVHARPAAWRPGRFSAATCSSTNEADVRSARRGRAGPRLPTQRARRTPTLEEVRIAFDGDAVLFSDGAKGASTSARAWTSSRPEQATAPRRWRRPPLPLLRALHRLQRERSQGMRVRTTLVTTRSAPAHERAIPHADGLAGGGPTRRSSGGLAGGEFLREFEPDFFFDDQTRRRGAPRRTRPRGGGRQQRTLSASRRANQNDRQAGGPGQVRGVAVQGPCERRVHPQRGRDLPGHADVAG